MFDEEEGIPRWLRQEIENAFLAASRNPGLTNALAAKLQKNVGIFGAASLFLPAGEEAD